MSWRTEVAPEGGPAPGQTGRNAVAQIAAQLRPTESCHGAGTGPKASTHVETAGPTASTICPAGCRPPVARGRGCASCLGPFVRVVGRLERAKPSGRSDRSQTVASARTASLSARARRRSDSTVVVGSPPRSATRRCRSPSTTASRAAATASTLSGRREWLRVETTTWIR